MGRAKARALPTTEGWSIVTSIRHHRREYLTEPPPFTPYESHATHKTFLTYRQKAPTLAFYITNPTNLTPSYFGKHPQPTHKENHPLELMTSNHQHYPTKGKRPASPSPPPPRRTSHHDRTYAQVAASPPTRKEAPVKHPLTLDAQRQLHRQDRPFHQNQGRYQRQDSKQPGRSSGKRYVPFKPLSPAALARLLKYLPFPPNPEHPAWEGRCFDCFTVGHRPGACRGHMICHKCKRPGHMAKHCQPRQPVQSCNNAALQPRGNIGEATMPGDRPDSAASFIHETPNFMEEIERLRKGLVIDARYVQGHDLIRVNGHFACHLDDT